MDMKMHTYGQNVKNCTVCRHWGKRLAVLACALSALTLSACTETDDFILRQSGVIPEEDYQKYIELRESGLLDLDGQYIAPAMTAEPSPEPEGIHVTFAKNAYMEVEYYLDAELSQPVNLKECYLKPGDCIYSAEPACKHPVTDKYSFDHFSVYAYDEAGKKGEELFWSDEDAESPHMVLRIPADYEGTEISVVPLGKYEKRMVKLTDYYETNHQQELDGTWIIDDGNDGNGLETTDDKVVVSPVTTLAVDYRYDNKKYEFVSAEPEAFYHEKGLVKFEFVHPNQNIEQFSVELRKLEGTFRFDPDDYVPEHGKVEFSYNGKLIDGVTDIEDSGIIYYTLTPDEGYHTRDEKTEGSISVNAGNQQKTKEKISEAIGFFPDRDIIVYLPQPKAGGEIEYYANGDRLLGGQRALKSGTTITMKFNHWNGWIVDAKTTKEYIVGEEDNQTVSFGGSDLSQLFKESDDHKPVLNLVVKDSMKSARFSVITSENEVADLSYDKGSKTAFYQSDREIFGSEKVGTGSNIVLSVTDDTIFNGQAMKLEIKTKDAKGNEEKFVRYVTELPAEQTIKLYGSGQQMTSPTVYERVTITVSKVDVSTYNAKPVDNAKMVVRVVDDDEPYTLKDGDVVEPSRKVEITIKPDGGWYIIGSKLLSGEYRDTMKYSDWEKDCKKILEKHTAQKLWYVTLDTSDNYGTCVYKLDGVTVSGTVGVHGGQKLELEYTITNPDYEITRSGFLGKIRDAVHKDNETSNISISEELDGTTIRRSDYIIVAQKED